VPFEKGSVTVFWSQALEDRAIAEPFIRHAAMQSRGSKCEETRVVRMNKTYAFGAGDGCVPAMSRLRRTCGSAWRSSFAASRCQHLKVGKSIFEWRRVISQILRCGLRIWPFRSSSGMKSVDMIHIKERSMTYLIWGTVAENIITDCYYRLILSGLIITNRRFVFYCPRCMRHFPSAPFDIFQKSFKLLLLLRVDFEELA